jgi:aldose 1-epimerase
MVCASLRHRGAELLGRRKGLEAYAQSGSTMGVPLLYPWANRIAARRFEVLGRTVDLDRAPHRFRDDGETGLPMHGAVAAGGAWSVEAQTEDALRASFDWSADDELMAAFPFEHRVTMEVSVEPGAARWRVRVDGEAPVAFGFHPYLRAAGDMALDVPVRERVVLDDHKLPTGERAPAEPITGPLGDRTFDDAFSAPTGPCRLGPLRLSFEEGFPYAQVFRPPGEDLVSFEPMTAPANALVTGEALLRAPHAASFAIAVGSSS